MPVKDKNAAAGADPFSIGVAKSKSPLGPWVDAIGAPLLTTTQTQIETIDPAFFVDNDGTGYLHFGTFNSELAVKMQRDANTGRTSYVAVETMDGTADGAPKIYNMRDADALANIPDYDASKDVLGSEDYLLHPEELAGLERAADDPAVLARLEEIKALNKQRLAAWVFRTDGFSLNSDAILDVQVKRLHEYKRQLLCAMRITQLQLLLHDDPDQPFQPRTFLFAAKAAPGYATAKRIIQLLCSLAADVNADPVCRGRLQVYFLPNYRVSAAEMLMPAAQVSEQISTAGKEASGTGNMKLMMNGAVTIGTLDGANVEMFEQLGADNMFLFGLHADEAEALRAAGYDPQAYVRRSPWLGRVLERMSRGYADGESYADLVSSLLYGGDPYLLLADFDDYAATHERLYTTIADPAVRARLSLVNIARSGIFAADRAVREYAERIWEVHA